MPRFQHVRLKRDKKHHEGMGGVRKRERTLFLRSELTRAPSSAVKEGWGNLERNERQPLSCHQLFPGPKAPAEEQSHRRKTARQTETEGKKGEKRKKKRAHVQLPALSGWRLMEKEQGGGQTAASFSISIFVLLLTRPLLHAFAPSSPRIWNTRVDDKKRFAGGAANGSLPPDPWTHATPPLQENFQQNTPPCKFVPWECLVVGLFHLCFTVCRPDAAQCSYSSPLMSGLLFPPENHRQQLRGKYQTLERHLVVSQFNCICILEGVYSSRFDPRVTSSHFSITRGFLLFWVFLVKFCVFY